MLPTLGRIVRYNLSAGDCDVINEQTPQIVDGRQVRNSVREGDVLPAQVVAEWGESGGTANLIVQLDGHGQYWATSRLPGDGPGTWAWPSREED